MPNPVQIFEAGSWTDSRGIKRDFPDSALDQMVQTYDPKTHEAPILINHNETGPNFGLIQSVFRDGARLFAVPHKVASNFAELVNGGRWPRLSTGFYHPDDSANPYPGKWAIREVSAVQIPGVKGMLSPTFREVGEAPPPTPHTVWIEVGEPVAKDGLSIFFKEQDMDSPKETQEANPGSDFDVKFAELERRTAELALKEVAMERRAGDVSFVERLVDEGRITGPDRKQQAIALLQSCRTQGVAFSEGASEEDRVDFTQHGLLKRFFKALPVGVEYKEIAKGGTDAPMTGGTLTTEQIVTKAKALQAKREQEGNPMLFNEAVRAIADEYGVE